MAGLISWSQRKIIRLSNILDLSLPGDDYSRNTSCVINLIYLYLYYCMEPTTFSSRGVGVEGSCSDRKCVWFHAYFFSPRGKGIWKDSNYFGRVGNKASPAQPPPCKKMVAALQMNHDWTYLDYRHLIPKKYQEKTIDCWLTHRKIEILFQ